MNSRSVWTVVTLTLSLILAPRPALAVWPHSPSQSIQLSNTTGASAVFAISDGAGGFIAAWSEFRSPTASYDIVMQRMDALGNRLWSPSGVLVCNATGDQVIRGLVTDHAGGAYLVWTDLRSGNSDIYAQRVNSSGVPLWIANGVAVCAAAREQSAPSMAPGVDSTAGVFLAWQDFRSGTNYDIYAQRLGASTGIASFLADGLLICNATGNQTAPAVAAFSNSNFYVAWTDARGANQDIYLQLINAVGTAQYAANGLAITPATAGDQNSVSIATDQTYSAGLFLTWADSRAGNYDIYAQYVTTGGGNLYTAGGAPVCTAAGNQTNPHLATFANGSVPVIAWDDLRSPSGYADVYAQRLTPLGTGQWTTDGVALTTAIGTQNMTALAVDSQNNTIVAWVDFRDSPAQSDLYAQRITPDGTLTWATNGVPVCTANGSQFFQNGGIVADATGGAFLVFSDLRDYLSRPYAQHIDRFGMLGAEPSIASVDDVPNDQGGVVKLAWNASPLDTDPIYYNISQYRIYRSSAPNAAANLLASGAAHLEGANGRGPAFVTTRFRTDTYYWELVDSASAEHLANYSLLVPTSADSTPSYNPLTAFMVRARTAAGTQWWDSAPDSGYSADNLAPAAPAPFSGNYANGTTTLHWNPNLERDFAQYQLYRGSSVDFPIDEAHLVATQPDTGYTDAAGQPFYYKLVAVDSHSNVSPPAILLPAGTTDVPGPAAKVFALSMPRPNPAPHGAELAFTLASRGHTRLELVDAGGRIVRVFADRVLDAGDHSLHWDGRDAHGRTAAVGFYFLRLEQGAQQRVAGLVVAP